MDRRGFLAGTLVGTSLLQSSSVSAQTADDNELVLNVRDFGATGDGEDQTASIEAAVEAAVKETQGARTSRRQLYFPAGKYAISRPIEIDRTIWINGEGPSCTEIINKFKIPCPTPSPAPEPTPTPSPEPDPCPPVYGKSALIFKGEAGKEIYYAKVSNIAIYGGSGFDTGSGISATYCGRMVLDNVWCSHHLGHGISYTNSWSPEIINCRADNNKGSGLHIQGGPNHKVNGALIIGGAYSKNDLDGVYLDASSASDSISGTLIMVGATENGRDGFRMLNNAVKLESCFSEYNADRQLRIGNSSKVLVGTTVSHSFFDGLNVGNYLVQIENAKGVLVEACNFKNAPTAIYVHSSARNVEIGRCRKENDTVDNLFEYQGNTRSDADVVYKISQETEEL